VEEEDLLRVKGQMAIFDLPSTEAKGGEEPSLKKRLRRNYFSGLHIPTQIIVLSVDGKMRLVTKVELSKPIYQL
jgi:hypothetical protein